MRRCQPMAWKWADGTQEVTVRLGSKIEVSHKTVLVVMTEAEYIELKRKADQPKWNGKT